MTDSIMVTLKVPRTLLNPIDNVPGLNADEIIELIISGFSTAKDYSDFTKSIRHGIECIVKVSRQDFIFSDAPLTLPEVELNNLLNSKGLKMFYESLSELVPEDFTLTNVIHYNDRNEVIFHGYQ